MVRENKISMKDILEFILIIISIGILAFSQSVSVSIVVSIIIILQSLISNKISNTKKIDILSKIKESSQTYLVYKESNLSNNILNFLFIFTSVLNIHTTYISSEFYTYGSESNSFFTFIENGSTYELTRVIMFVTIIVIFLLNILKSINSTVAVSDDCLVYHDKTIVDFSKITSTEYVHQYFYRKKHKLLRVNTKGYYKKIIVDLNDNGTLKTYLDSKIIKNNI